jgi:tRNA 2-selenouridine synthase
MLYKSDFPAPVVLLDGNTGTAKTDLLQLVAARGHQVIDLEGLANHRGSVLGPRAGGQPSQKMFETRLAAAIAALDPARPVLLEAESSKVGGLLVPSGPWKAMRAAPRITVTATLADRAAYLARAYADLVEDRAALLMRLDKLLPYVGHDVLEAWRGMVAQGAFEPLATDLMARHYDHRYAKGRPAFAPLGDDLSITLDAPGLDRAADAIAERLAGLPGGQSASKT